MINARPILTLLGVLLLLGPAVFGAAAQDAAEDRAPEADPHRAIALIDVGDIHTRSPRFVEKMAELKLEVRRAETVLKEKQKAVEDMTRGLQLCTVGTPEHPVIQRPVFLREIVS